MRTQVLGMEEEREKSLLIRVFTIGAILIGNCVLPAVGAVYCKNVVLVTTVLSTA
jgi:hypothetical protein